MILKIFTFCIFILGLSSITNASENNFYDKGKKLFDEEKYEESKFQFERSIVYNPKHSNSYLYLGKIFKIENIEIHGGSLRYYITHDKNNNFNIKAILDGDIPSLQGNYLLVFIVSALSIFFIGIISAFLNRKYVKKNFKN